MSCRQSSNAADGNAAGWAATVQAAVHNAVLSGSGGEVVLCELQRALRGFLAIHDNPITL